MSLGGARGAGLEQWGRVSEGDITVGPAASFFAHHYLSLQLARCHRDVWESIMKTCGGDGSKWYRVTHAVFIFFIFFFVSHFIF